MVVQVAAVSLPPGEDSRGKSRSELLKAEWSSMLINNPLGPIACWPLAGGWDEAQRE